MKNEQLEKTLELVKNEVENVAVNSRIVVNSQPTFDIAKAQLIILKSVDKEVQSKKDGIVKPLNEALKNARALFKPFEDKIEVIKQYLNGEMLKYNQKLLAEQKKREEEAMKKIEEAEKKGEEININKIIKKLENTQTKIEQIKTRKIKKFRLIDITKVPKEYLQLNEVEVRKAMLGGYNVEGVEYYEEEISINSY